MLESKPWLEDPKVAAMPWNIDIGEAVASTKKSGFTFGVMRHDGVVTPHPPIQRGMEWVISALRSQGHEVYLRCFIFIAFTLKM